MLDAAALGVFVWLATERDVYLGTQVSRDRMERVKPSVEVGYSADKTAVRVTANEGSGPGEVVPLGYINNNLGAHVWSDSW